MGKVRCLVCGMVLVSVNRHDFVQCNCNNKAFVDGGDDYLKCGAKQLSKIEVWTEKHGWIPIKKKPYYHEDRTRSE